MRVVKVKLKSGEIIEREFPSVEMMFAELEADRKEVSEYWVDEE